MVYLDLQELKGRENLGDSEGLLSRKSRTRREERITCKLRSCRPTRIQKA